MWPDVLARLREIKLTPWSLIAQNSEVVELNDNVLVLAFKQPNLRDTFARREDVQNFLKQAVHDVLLIDLRFDAIVDPSANPSAGSARPSSPAASPRQASRPQASAADSQPPAAVADPGPAMEPEPEHSMDDADLEDDGLSERDLLARTLGATVIQELDSNDS
jgi:DNA polymerase-3 subunit gamma/tau